MSQQRHFKILSTHQSLQWTSYITQDVYLHILTFTLHSRTHNYNNLMTIFKVKKTTVLVMVRVFTFYSQITK